MSTEHEFEQGLHKILSETCIPMFTEQFPVEVRLYQLVNHFNAIVGLIERNEKDAEAFQKRIQELETQLVEEENENDRFHANQQELVTSLRAKLTAVCPHTDTDVAPGIGPYCTFCGTECVPIKD